MQISSARYFHHSILEDKDLKGGGALSGTFISKYMKQSSECLNRLGLSLYFSVQVEVGVNVNGWATSSTPSDQDRTLLLDSLVITVIFRC